MARETERIRLTLDRIRKLTPPAGSQAVYVFDDDPKQLCVRVTPAGAKSFGFRAYWVNRAGAPVERLGTAPDAVVADLAGLAGLLGG